MQTSLPLLIVRSSILNLDMHFSTQPLTGEIKCPRKIHLPCAFHFISSNVDATHTPILINKWYDLVHIIMWPYWFIDLDLTCSSPLHRSIGAKSLLKHPTMQSSAWKPPTCLSLLQPVHQAKPHLDLLHLSHMTYCHVSYAMSSFITYSPMD